MSMAVARYRWPVVFGGLLATFGTYRPALADPWVPPAGTGIVAPMVRLFQSSGAYSASGFTINTLPASNQSETQLRVTGVAGIGNGFSIEYDLRAGRVRVARTRRVRIGRKKRSVQIAQTSSGAEDQAIGLNYALTQTKGFADSIMLTVVIPTGSISNPPALGSGHFAVEPDFQAGIAHGSFSASMEAGARVFTDSGAVQIRGTLYGGVRVAKRVSLLATAFVSRSVQQTKALPLSDLGEVYNIVRIGVGAQYRLNRAWRPFVEYDDTIAGQGIHAGRRIVVGVSIRY